MVLDKDWQECQTQAFWGEIAPADHVLQIYDNTEVFLDTLVDFVGNGINAGDSVIVIATKEHLQAVHQKLSAHTLKMQSLISEGQYIPLDAKECLAKFMVNGWPDELLFRELVSGVMLKARQKNRQVRAFGEMVALLWEQGECEATVALEKMWNSFCANQAFCLFCAYPKSGFAGDPFTSVHDICCAHSKVISGDNHRRNKLSYQTLSM
jgi:hypothetical protein